MRGTCPPTFPATIEGRPRSSTKPHLDNQLIPSSKPLPERQDTFPDCSHTAPTPDQFKGHGEARQARRRDVGKSRLDKLPPGSPLVKTSRFAVSCGSLIPRMGAANWTPQEHLQMPLLRS
ncbi:hypothetical protein J6590_020853 [Homalodisca vitripennis]|nr:hypothetical protein J6590_020853 [Homalodisca vitripennis]